MLHSLESIYQFYNSAMRYVPRLIIELQSHFSPQNSTAFMRIRMFSREYKLFKKLAFFENILAFFLRSGIIEQAWSYLYAHQLNFLKLRCKIWSVRQTKKRQRTFNSSTVVQYYIEGPDGDLLKQLCSCVSLEIQSMKNFLTWVYIRNVKKMIYKIFKQY